MAKWKIVATYEHEGVVQAGTSDEAEKNFLANLNRFYAGTVDYKCVRVCDDCEEEVDEYTGYCDNGCSEKEEE
jgi:hypothetical protein